MGRSCTVCQHDARDEIDRAIVSGRPYREIAERHDVTISALSRHKDGHISPALAKLQARREANGAETLLDRAEALYGRVEGILDAATEDGKVTISLTAIREMRGMLELLGRISGELREGPQQVVNILQTGDWQQVRTAVFEALADHPDAREAVSRRLLEIGTAS